jgi:hypothetical protein
VRGVQVYEGDGIDRRASRGEILFDVSDELRDELGVSAEGGGPVDAEVIGESPSELVLFFSKEAVGSQEDYDELVRTMSKWHELDPSKQGGIFVTRDWGRTFVPDSKPSAMVEVNNGLLITFATFGRRS